MGAACVEVPGERQTRRDDAPERTAIFGLVVSLLIVLVSGAAEGSPRHPLFKWAQDRRRIFITIHVPLVKEEDVDLSEQGLKWTGVGGKDGQTYSLDLSFYKPLNVSTSSWKKLDKNFQFTLEKAVDEAHWPCLLSTSNKLEEGNMRIDWTRWDLESTQDEDEDKPRTKKRKSKRKVKKAAEKAEL